MPQFNKVCGWFDRARSEIEEKRYESRENFVSVTTVHKTEQSLKSDRYPVFIYNL